jgi:transcriptional regulator GlxA family with amidase domain
MHPLITQAIVTDRVREMHTRAALADQARRARRTHPAPRGRFALVRAGLLAGPNVRRALRAV